MLSPFRGVMHSVVTRWADAVTTDGRHWTLYVRGECLYDDVADLERDGVAVPDVKYGSWSEKAGLRRAPIRLPTFDERVREEGENLLRAVKAHAHRLPFPLTDRFELWLLHGQTGLPLALLGSCCREGDCEPATAARWTPGQACMAEIEEARTLQAIIADLAGMEPQAQWFERHMDGSGTACHGDPPPGAPLQQALPEDCFAPLFVDHGALHEEQADLLQALLQWQSPTLLQLPGLSAEQRAALEVAACSHALRLAEQLPLYPCIVDRAAITAALVEARLRRSQGDDSRTETRAKSLPPYYLEVPDP